MNNFFVISNTHVNLYKLYSKISNISIITHIKMFELLFSNCWDINHFCKSYKNLYPWTDWHQNDHILCVFLFLIDTLVHILMDCTCPNLMQKIHFCFLHTLSISLSQSQNTQTPSYAIRHA